MSGLSFGSPIVVRPRPTPAPATVTTAELAIVTPSTPETTILSTVTTAEKSTPSFVHPIPTPRLGRPIVVRALSTPAPVIVPIPVPEIKAETQPLVYGPHLPIFGPDLPVYDPHLPSYEEMKRIRKKRHKAEKRHKRHEL